MVAVEGETVSILCSTQSNPDPILTIFKEKQILATVIYESQLQLELPAVTPEDDGEYWCVAENQYGQRATTFNLSVECEYPSAHCSPTPYTCDGWLSGGRLGDWEGTHISARGSFADEDGDVREAEFIAKKLESHHMPGWDCDQGGCGILWRLPLYRNSVDRC